MSNLSDLEVQLNAVKSTVESLSKQIVEARKEATDFKPNDLLICKDKTTSVYQPNTVYRAGRQTGRDNLDVYGADGDYTNYCTRSYFRKADPIADRAAIETFLLAEAEREGFRVGAKAVSKRSGTFLRVMKVFVAFDGTEPDMSNRIEIALRDARQPIVCVTDVCSSLPISDLTVVKEESISITVDNQEYKADFSDPDFVTFGCAKISRQLIRDAAGLAVRKMDGNRQITAIMIGKGVFTPEVLSTLVAEMNK